MTCAAVTHLLADGDHATQVPGQSTCCILKQDNLYLHCTVRHIACGTSMMSGLHVMSWPMQRQYHELLGNGLAYAATKISEEYLLVFGDGQATVTTACLQDMLLDLSVMGWPVQMHHGSKCVGGCLMQTTSWYQSCASVCE